MSLDIDLIDHNGNCLFSTNITHNLGKMASEAGIYDCLWRPDEIGATKASEVADRMFPGFVDLLKNRAKYEQFNPPNGWGNYDRFRVWCYEYLCACLDNPDCLVEVSR